MENCLAVLRKEGCRPLRGALHGGPGNTIAESALSLIMGVERDSSFLSSYSDLVLEAPFRDDLSWDETHLMRTLLGINDRLRTTVFVDHNAHSRCLNPQNTPRGANALVDRLSSHNPSPRIFLGDLGRLTPSELQTGWGALDGGDSIYRMNPVLPPTPQKQQRWTPFVSLLFDR